MCIYFIINDNKKKIERLTIENYICAVYIVISFLNIYGDELVKKHLRSNDEVANKKAINLFRKIVIANIVIYLYFLSRNYSEWKENNYDKKHLIRFIGSFLVFVGTLCFFYFQSSISTEDDSLSNI